MDLIYIVIGEAEYATFSELDVRNRLADGQLSPETYFWKEGMEDWRPLTEMPPLPKPKPPPPILPPQRPLSVSPAPGYAAIRSSPNRLKSTHPIALGRRIANDPEPFHPPESTGPTAALPKRTTSQTSWASPTPRLEPVAPLYSSSPAPDYTAPEAPFVSAAPRQVAYPAPEISPAPTPVLSAPKIAPQYFLREDLEPMTRVVLVVLGFSFCSGLLCLYLCLKHYRLLTGTYTFEQESASLSLIGISFQIAEAVFVAAAIPFLIWVYRINENCHSFIPGTRFGTGWAVGSFFIPLFNLVRPFQVLQDAWKVSTRPLGWADQGFSIVVVAWELLWVSGFGMAATIWYFSSMSGEGDDSIRLIELYIVGAANYVGLCFMAAIMVFAITYKQKKLVKISID